MAKWVTGQSGNPAGRPRQDKKVKDLVRKIGPAAIKRLEKISRGEPVRDGDPPPPWSEIRRANEYLADRCYGKAAAVSDGSSGTYQGATIIVDTGIRRDLPPPTVDVTPIKPDD